MNKQELNRFIDKISPTGPGGVEKIKRVLKEVLDKGEEGITEEELLEALSGKQDTIQDLSEIRSGAALANNSDHRPYDSSNPDGMGYLVLKKNKTFAEQVTEENTIYEIRYDFDLGGASVTIPANCTLKFTGGKIANGTLVGNNTSVDAPDYEIFERGVAKYHGYYTTEIYAFEYAASYSGVILSGTWENEYVSPCWNGLFGVGTDECSFAINNHILLFGGKNKVVFPQHTFYIYGRVRVSASVDFNHAIFKNIADFSSVEDTSISIPSGATSVGLRSLYGLVDVNLNNGIVENLTIDCQSTQRSESVSTFGGVGVACGLSISSNNGLVLKNISISNCPECGICAAAIYDCVFDKIDINNVGEHGIYHHAVQGNLTFKDCNFVDYSNDDSIIQYRGASAAVKFSGAASDFVSGYNAIFDSCVFNGTNSKNRALLYSEMPPLLKFISCTFLGNCGGYQSVGDYAAISQKQNVLIFDSCNGIPAPLTNYVKNLDVSYYNCKNARFYFHCLAYAENCDFVLGYVDPSTTQVTYGATLDDPIIIRNCNFSDAITNYQIKEIHNFARTRVVFDRCTINHPGTYENRNVTLWTMNNVTKLEILQSSITSQYTSIFNVSSCVVSLMNDTIIADGTYALVAGTSIELTALDCTMICNDGNHVGLAFVGYSAASSWKVQGLKTTGLNQYERTWTASLADGGVTTIPNYRYFHLGVPSAVDLSKYVEIVPESNFATFTFEVANNGDGSNSTITIHNGSQAAIKYRIKLDFTNKPV